MHQSRGNGSKQNIKMYAGRKKIKASSDSGIKVELVKKHETPNAGSDLGLVRREIASDGEGIAIVSDVSTTPSFWRSVY